jgi:Uma2 family endonuclease
MTLAATPKSVRFSADEFQRMAEAGLLSNRAELIDGRVFKMPPQGVPHMLAISKIGRALARVATPDEWVISQGTMRLDPDTTIDPDFQWVAAAEGTDWRHWPSPLLIIEVSETTYRRDKGLKLRKYAMAGVTDYWIINCKARRLEVYRDPFNPTGHVENCGYRGLGHFAAGDRVAPLNRPDVSFDVADLLP